MTLTRRQLKEREMGDKGDKRKECVRWKGKKIRKGKEKGQWRKENRSNTQGKRLSLITITKGHAERRIIRDKRGGPDDYRGFFDFFYSSFNLAMRAPVRISHPANISSIPLYSEEQETMKDCKILIL